jgi:molybdenum cofactor cytidylyltransferase
MKPAELNPGALVLAAGGSTRLGRPKQLIRYQDEALVRRAVRAAIEIQCEPVVAVCGPEFSSVRQELAGLQVTVVENPNWKSGMASSLTCGLEAALRSMPQMDALLVTLCDQPLIDAAELLRLISFYRESGAAAAASRYGDSGGPPAIFGRPLFPQMKDLQGDAGAKRILRALGNQVAWMDLPEGAMDIDTPDDLARLAESERVRIRPNSS